jgi:hypothetical protein
MCLYAKLASIQVANCFSGDYDNEGTLFPRGPLNMSLASIEEARGLFVYFCHTRRISCFTRSE